MNILDKIVSVKKEEVQRAKQKRSLSDFDLTSQSRNFEQALRDKNPAVIAEIKKASPSKGIIRENFDPVAIAKSYEAHGAACLSVLTDKQFFQGDDEYLNASRNATALPVLRKDFMIDSYQIYETKDMGADCILLIASILDNHQLHDFSQLASELELSYLVECHTHDEVERALPLEGHLIGINNRNLNTFKTDINTSIELAKMIPKDKIIITESGINSAKDIQLMKANNIHTFLIGESLMREEDPGLKLSELIH